MTKEQITNREKHLIFDEKNTVGSQPLSRCLDGLNVKILADFLLELSQF